MKDALIAFGSTDRLRVTRENGLLWAVHERKIVGGDVAPAVHVKTTPEEMDGWEQVTAIPIQENQIGDLCASLAREYDKSVDGKMNKTKTWYDQKLASQTKE